MKRDILRIRLGKMISGCCPGHDDYPNSSYKNRKSKKARAKGKKVEHRYFRRVMKQKIAQENH